LFSHTFIGNIAVSLTVLSIVDLVAGVFSVLFFPIGYFAGKSVTRIASDLAFVEGALLFFVGALMAFIHSHRTSRMKALMIVGAAMFMVSVVFGMSRL
jgi:hypothetical protein